MPLQAKGLFNDPSPPEFDTDAGTVRHPIWPPSRYLARMAAVESDSIKDSVFEIARGIDDLTNASIQEDLIAIALALPATQACAFATRAANWSESPFPMMLEKARKIRDSPCFRWEIGRSIHSRKRHF